MRFLLIVPCGIEIHRRHRASFSARPFNRTMWN